MDWGYILCVAAVHMAVGWWMRNTAVGRWVLDYLQNWKTDNVTGVGLAFVIVLLPMVLVVLGVKFGLLGR